ncbi:MAG TPA: PspC domain-containing protein, partial [Nocardioidaceae bacterium]|nr:PspC domain-containing protein [Nocardioidaceae bacterium]
MTEQTPADTDGFDPGRIRTIDDMRRPSDDRMVAGVCAAIARHLDIDPVVVRVVIACLSFAGLAGVIV